MIFRRKFLLFILILSLVSLAKSYAADAHSHSSHEHSTSEFSLNCIDCYINIQSVGLDFQIKYIEFSNTHIVLDVPYPNSQHSEFQFFGYQSRAP